MSATPKTLLALAGAPATPSPLDTAALLLIDAQREYTEGALPLVGVEAAVAEAARLLERARKAGTPVFHIVHHGKPGGALFNPEGPLSGIVAPLIPLDGETVVVKHLPNAFAGTELDALIRATGRKELIVAGFQTHMCVSSTVRAALDLGWRTTVVDAASATRDLPDGAGGVIPAEALHRANLAALADRFAVVVKDSRAWG
ncbi:isochorismatase (plasmid) [Azospirillum argentinense]|uniref:Cysteine hydrolase n=1 Tax=Azospirillum argentinense TaxID=2970906 RepID=A0A060DVZ9_9PROT|nr:cysteine hydrolase family protein [Azospirillum argentinense]AIB15313.1 isochorismatase [Azospirillum argentinense]EZQ04118.1 isochorismatase [Azospirillum argentinense]PNQ98739.1 cysteine hydrolase [Azospirillum argentinense]